MIVLRASTTARHAQLTNTRTYSFSHNSTGKHSYVLVLCSTPPPQKEKDFCLPSEGRGYFWPLRLPEEIQQS